MTLIYPNGIRAPSYSLLRDTTNWDNWIRVSLSLKSPDTPARDHPPGRLRHFPLSQVYPKEEGTCLWPCWQLQSFLAQKHFRNFEQGVQYWCISSVVDRRNMLPAILRTACGLCILQAIVVLRFCWEHYKLVSWRHHKSHHTGPCSVPQQLKSCVRQIFVANFLS